MSDGEDMVMQGPGPAKPHPHRFGFLLESYWPGSITRVLKMFVANGELSDYDDELANRVHDAIEVVEKAPSLVNTLVQIAKGPDTHSSGLAREVLASNGIDFTRWKS